MKEFIKMLVVILIGAMIFEALVNYTIDKQNKIDNGEITQISETYRD